MPASILVVDDDAGVQLTIQSILEDEGYEVLVAADGLEGLARLDGYVPAAILLDITMPRMDGFAFAERLKELGLRERIPLIVLTADGRAQQKAAQLGAVDWVSKPFTLDRLLNAVARAVQ